MDGARFFFTANFMSQDVDLVSPDGCGHVR
jgi:hypothetical protein